MVFFYQIINSMFTALKYVYEDFKIIYIYYKFT